MSESCANCSDLEGQLSEAQAAHAAKDALVQDLTQQREQLMRLIDELSVQVASCPIEAPSGDQEPSAQVVQLQEQVEELTQQRQALEQQLAAYATLEQQLGDLQQRHEQLTQQHNGALESLQASRGSAAAAHVSAALGCANGSPSAGPDQVAWQQRMAELQQQLEALESEMSDVQAACNLAVAEKHALEATLSRRQVLQWMPRVARRPLSKDRSIRTPNHAVGRNVVWRENCYVTQPVRRHH